ncbi:MAG: ABC transporter permease [Planctomycetes bacterium]|nr:ABC transporter permease [Planctomycetota bacterium]
MPTLTAEQPATTTTPQGVQPVRAALALAGREMLRFVRQRNRVFGALGQPIIFWLLFGAGLSPTFKMADAGGASGAADAVSYTEYFFPGTLVLILLFTAIFATISIIEDRREGFLQAVLVAPIPGWSIVAGKVLGAASIATLQALIFLALGPLLGLRYTLQSVALIGLLTFAISFALAAVGFIMAWRMDSTQGFHAMMNVFLMPMWLLSGAFFPVEHGSLRWLGAANPLTYGVSALRHLIYGSQPRAAGLLADLPSAATSWGVTFLFAAIAFAVACRMTRTRTKGDLL